MISSSQEKKNILLTGARSPCALELARLLHDAGHHVYIADTSSLHVSRFSNAIEEFFVIPSPRFHCEKFIEKLLEVVETKKIDLLIPIWEEVMYLSQNKERFPEFCEVFCAPFDVIHELHNKMLFIEKLESFGWKTPKTYLIHSKEELADVPLTLPYILKASYSRAAQAVVKVDSKEIPDISICPENPWIAQEYLHGKNYCTFGVCRDGKVLAHAVYPVVYTLDGHSCLAFESVNNTKIFDWVSNFVRKVNYTGQIAFDFIETPDGELYAIECNPRATSGIHLFRPEDRLDRAYLGEVQETIFAKPGTTKQVAAGMLIYGWRFALAHHTFSEYMKKFLTTKDVVFSSQDLKPFLFEPLVVISYLIKGRQLGLSLPALFTYDLDWDVDPSMALQERDSR